MRRTAPLRDLERLQRDKDLQVQIFNGARHVRVNGVIDVWPSTKRWMPTRARQKAARYADYDELRAIIQAATDQRAAVVEQIATLTTNIEAKPPVRGIASHEEFKRKFG
jgi:hypothetical protein